MVTHPHGPLPLKHRLKHAFVRAIIRLQRHQMKRAGIKTSRQRIKDYIDKRANMRRAQKITNKELASLITWNERGRDPHEQEAVIRRLMPKK